MLELCNNATVNVELLIYRAWATCDPTRVVIHVKTRLAMKLLKQSNELTKRACKTNIPAPKGALGGSLQKKQTNKQIEV